MQKTTAKKKSSPDTAYTSIPTAQCRRGDPPQIELENKTLDHIVIQDLSTAVEGYGLKETKGAERKDHVLQDDYTA
jgi:hypothetical protein